MKIRTLRVLLAAILPIVALAAPVNAAATPSQRATGAASAAVPPADTWQGPLSTRGRYIVDADGNRFKLKSANWHGAQGSWTGSGDVNDPANHTCNAPAPRVASRTTKASN
ncbi:hypothetical protein [Embleya sp. NBC_00888]|uniref:hypothetical protein n=1 Tax=Embleya sp. NBC_00888 TaxID=2975960 RepID=UPI00386CB40F